MFGLGRTKVTAEEAAVKVMQMVAWTGEQDAAFRQQVNSYCTDIAKDRYDCEYFCLRVFTGLAAARTAFNANDEEVWDEFIEQYVNQFHMYARQTLKQDGLEDLAFSRLREYAEACDPNNPSLRSRGVAELFSEFCCGVPDDNTLKRIGSSTYLVRGDAMAQALKKLVVRKN